MAEDLRTRQADQAIAVRSNGTLLQDAHRLRGSGVPILGLNIGHLGLITPIRGGCVRRDMKRVLDAEFILSQRPALDLEIHRGLQRVTG